MGRPAKTAQQEKLTGVKSQRRVVDSQIVGGRPKFPRGLLPNSTRSIFKQLCDQLEARHTLTESDGYLLGVFCTAYDRAARAQEKLKAQGEICSYTRLDSNGQPHQMEKPNLWLKVAQEAEREMLACIDRLGISPLAREKVKAVAAAEGPTDVPFEQMSSSDRMRAFINKTLHIPTSPAAFPIITAQESLNETTE